MSNLRKELAKEKRMQKINELFNEALSTVILEQESVETETETAPAAAPADVAPEPVASTPNTPVQPDPQTNSPSTLQADQISDLTVDEMIEKLNTIRGGRSFTDPDVYSHLIDFFKALSGKERNLIEKMLNNVAKAVTGFAEEEAEAAEEAAEEVVQQVVSDTSAEPVEPKAEPEPTPSPVAPPAAPAPVTPSE